MPTSGSKNYGKNRTEREIFGEYGKPRGVTTDTGSTGGPIRSKPEKTLAEKNFEFEVSGLVATGKYSLKQLKLLKKNNLFHYDKNGKFYIGQKRTEED